MIILSYFNEASVELYVHFVISDIYMYAVCVWFESCDFDIYVPVNVPE